VYIVSTLKQNHRNVKSGVVCLYLNSLQGIFLELSSCIRVSHRDNVDQVMMNGDICSYFSCTNIHLLIDLQHVYDVNTLEVDHTTTCAESAEIISPFSLCAKCRDNSVFPTAVLPDMTNTGQIN